MEEERPLRSRVALKIITMKREGDTPQLVGEQYVNVSGRELWASVREKHYKWEEVMEAPATFQFGVLYVMYGGKRAWIYNLEEGE